MAQFYNLQYLIDQTDLDGTSVCASQNVVQNIAFVLNVDSPYYTTKETINFSKDNNFSISRRIIVNAVNNTEQDLNITIIGYSNNVLITEVVVLPNAENTAQSVNYYDRIISIMLNTNLNDVTVGSIYNGGFIGPIILNSLLPLSSYYITTAETPVQAADNLQVNILASNVTGNGYSWVNYLSYFDTLGNLKPVIYNGDSFTFPGNGNIPFSLGKLLVFQITFSNALINPEYVSIQFLQNGV